jgi:hypothetical protein
MNAPISSGLKTTFLVHAIVGLLFGLAYLLIPTTVGGWFGFAATDPAWRLLGAAILAYALSSWWASRAVEWSKVEIVVQMEIVWTVLGALVTAWAVISGALPALGWLNALILAAFAVAFGYFLTRKS